MSETHNERRGEMPAPSYARPTSAEHGTLAEFVDVTSLTRACEKVRDAGYVHWDAHSPFPVHGLDAAMGVKPTKLPWMVLGSGLCGLAFAVWMQCWMNGIDYKFIISGKPLFSLPAFVPVTFEMTVLFSAFMTFFGSLALNKLPEVFHPLSLSARFRRATDDRFFVYIEAKDPLYDGAKVEALLRSCGTEYTEVIRYESHGPHTRLPAGTVGVTCILAALSLAPIALFAKARVSTSEKPRLHLNPPAPIKDDMDVQYKFKPQASNWFFDDQRAARQWPAGTVAQEDVVLETALQTGRQLSHGAVPGGASQAAYKDQRAKDGQELAQPSIPVTAPQAPFVRGIPGEISLTDRTLARGRERFNIYCGTCHGIAGHGDGMVHRHADALQEGTWVAPTNLHDQRVRELAAGDIFHTITHGIRNMPAYGHLIEPNDRWLIVAYVKALQQSLMAKASDVPQDIRPTLQ